MYNFFRRVSIVALLCLMQSFNTAKAFYINPGYEDFIRNKRDHTTVCVQIKPNGVESPEPFYMCQGPEFPPRQLIVPVQFLKPTDESFVNFNHQQPALQKPTGDNYQNFKQPQTLQFGNAHQLMPQSPQIGGGYLDNTKPPEAAEMHHYSLPSTANLEHHSDNLANNPSNIASQPQNNYENVRSSSETEKLLPATATNQNDENANARAKVMSPSKNEPNNSQQMSTTAAVKHNINSEQFKALLEEEVLGTPNLALSQDEMLKFQNMYMESKTENPLPSERFYIPPEYLDDPILRTFYNIDNDNTGAQQYVPKLIQQNKPILQEPSLPAGGVIKNCPHLPAYSMPQTESTVPITSGKCGDCPPFTYQPIFIAIPWPTTPYHDRMSNIQPISCGNLQTNSGTSYDNSYRSKSRANDDNASMEDLAKKDSSNPSDVPKNSAKPQTISTKPPESSEEDDLFVEDTTAKTDDAMKSNEDEQDDKKDEIMTSSTSVPHTTVRTFKTMMHAAKMYSQLANVKHNAPQEAQNKRHIQYMGGGGYPSNIKKEYLKKLETNYY